MTHSPSSFRPKSQRLWGNFTRKTPSSSQHGDLQKGCHIIINVMEKAEKDNTVKQRMQDILLCVSWREIANTYFDRPASWLYNKLNAIDDNGGFTEKEKELLRGALFDLSERIRRAAETI